jgi:signal transduction histidine kinase
MRADGTLVDTDVTLNYFEMNGKKYSQAIIRDITERKQAEAALLKTLKDLQETRNMLIQSEKFAAVGKLAAGAAHEINNPMNILSMRMQLMEITDPLTEMQQTSIDICRKQVARVVKIIKGLEVFSRTGQVKQVREDLNGLIKNILDLSSPRLKLENISANLDLDEEIPLANLDKDKIEQVLLILINNAADALAGKDKKILRITTNNIIGDDGEKRARLIVADNGYGIPEDNILRVFDPFFTTKDPDKGTGMGLSIAYRIVHDHGGTISVKNNEWGGASFVVELPVG